MYILTQGVLLVNDNGMVHSNRMDVSVRNWMANRGLFLSELAKGRKWEEYVASELKKLGYGVILPEVGEYEMPHDPKYANAHDMSVGGRIVEVKSRNLSFTDADSFPFGTIFVKTKASYDAMTDKPAMCVVVSQITGAMLALDVQATEKLWKPVRFFDRVRKIHTTAYECEKGRWEDVDAVAKRVLT